MFPKFRTPDVVDHMHEVGRIAGRTETEVDDIIANCEARYNMMVANLRRREREELDRIEEEIGKLMPISLEIGMDVVKGQNYIYNDMMFIALQSMHVDESHLPPSPSR